MSLLRIVQSTRRFRILEDAQGRQAYEHVACGMISWNREDVEKRYCGYCHEFATDVLVL